MARSRLQDEVKKRTPFAVPEQEAYLNLVRTSDRLQTRFLRLFREYGLTPVQYNILRILRGEREPLPCMEIASRLVSVVPGITGLIDRLEQAGLVARQRSVKDRREVRVDITGKATELLAQLDGPVLQLHRDLLGHLTSAELSELVRLLEKARLPLGEDV